MNGYCKECRFYIMGEYPGPGCQNKSSPVLFPLPEYGCILWEPKDGIKVYALRNPEQVDELPWRKWMRNELPGLPFPRQPADIVAEDIDLVVLTFGDTIGRDRRADGQFKILEVKQGWGKMDHSQRRMYVLIDRLLRAADPDRKFYLGFYTLYWQPPDDCRVNGLRMGMDELAQFFLDQVDIPALPRKDILDPEWMFRGGNYNDR